MTISSQNPRRIAVIGATGRVGTEVARTFARLGWSLELTARRMDGLDALMTEFESFATTASIRRHRLDFLDGSTIAEFIHVVGTQPLDAVVVAGSPFEEIPLEEATIERFTRQAAAQVGGPATLVAGLRPALERSLAPGGPAVIFFGDVHALHRPRAGATPYLAAKAAAEGLVGLLAVELAPIRVMGISPGVVGWPDDWPEDRRASYLKRVPLGRAGTAGEAAALARSLIIDATYCTGVVIPIDGGRHLR
jgi:NAD(P)-dependent dehydrogenase (short-subunit alcohol dehydrogenase family)